MPEYDNTNKGVLFTNDRRETDKHPNYKGSLNIDGIEFWLDAWIRDGQKGKFMSLSVKPKDAQRQAPIQPAPRPAPAVRPAPSRPQIDDDSDIPF